MSHRRHLVAALTPLALAATAFPAARAAPAPRGAVAPPTITASPAAGLTDAQEITVAGTAALGPVVLVEQCRQRVDDVGADCDPRTTAEASVAPDGTWRLPRFQVRRFLTLGGREHDCIVGCRLVILTDSAEPAARSRVLAFDPDAPVPPRPVLEVSPRTGITDRTEVTVTGRDFPPYVQVGVRQCTGPVDCFGGGALAVTGPGGRFSVRVVLRRVLDNFGEPVDCAAEGAVCIMRAGSEQARRAAAPVRLGFAPDPSPPLVLTVTPTDGLIDGQLLTATIVAKGDGLIEDVRQCARRPSGQPDLRQCTYVALLDYREVAGVATAALPVSRFVPGLEGPLDCAAAPGCVLAVLNGRGHDRVVVPISFASGPAPDPTATVEPASGITAGTPVRVTTTGLGTQLSLVQCAPGVTRITFPGCRGLSYSLEADGSRLVDLRRFVGPAAATVASRVDCANTPAPCVLLARSSLDDTRQAVAPLVFAAQPPPTDPTLAVLTTGRLSDRQRVDVLIGATERTWSLRQCALALGPALRQCTRLIAFGVTTEDGVTTARVYPHRRLGGATVDCATETCHLVLENGGFGVDRHRLRFDPDAPPPPAVPASMQVRPRRDLVDGQPVRVQVVDDEPGIVWQCPAEAPLEACQYLRTTGRTEPGQPTRFRATVARLLGPQDRRTDCAEAVGRCELRYVPSALGNEAEAVVVGLGFDPDVAPLGPLQLAVRPRTDLTDGQLVRVTLRGTADGYEESVRQCLVTSTGVAETTCRLLHPAGRVTAEPGLVSWRAEVRRILTVAGAEDVDCATVRIGRCAVVVGGARIAAVYTRAVPVNFDPAVPPLERPPPAITVSPTSGLVAGDEPTITGTGWQEAERYVFILQCAESELPASADGIQLDRCDARGLAEPSAAGTFTTSLRVNSEINGRSCADYVCFVAAFDDVAGQVALGPPINVAP